MVKKCSFCGNPRDLYRMVGELTIACYGCWKVWEEEAHKYQDPNNDWKKWWKPFYELNLHIGEIVIE